MGPHRLSLARAAVSVILAVVIGAALLAVPALLPALAWSGDPALNTVICAAAGEQDCPVVVPDGSGGAIVAWQDHRSPSGWDIYAQRVDSGGAALWALNGIAVTTAVSDQTRPAAVSDGHGGAIVVWQDRRGPDSDVYAQRVDASGVPQWADKGEAVCTAPGDQLSPILVSDGGGGAIIIWEDGRGGDGSDIYAQRMDPEGRALWTAGGTAICTAASDQTALSAMNDGAGGAIIAWQDARGGDYDVYAQRVDASSAALWAENGTAICALAGHQIAPAMAEDGRGGAIVAWPDARTGAGYDVYAQRMDPQGAAQWIPNGMPVCTVAGDQTWLAAASDGAGGAIIAWQDTRDGAGFDIYAQRMDPEGARQWTATGAPVCRAPEDQRSPGAVGRAPNGAIVVWQDRRGGAGYDIYAQSIDAAGNTAWSPNGVPLCTAPGDQVSLSVSAVGGGVVVAWQDARSLNEDIYIQRIQDTGILGLPPNQPVNLLPADRGQEVSLAPALQCSAFSPGQAGDTHAASQWRMTAVSGDYSRPVFDSGPDSLALQQEAPGPVALDGNTTYYWQVRHQSSNGLWSAWSAETSFTTLNREPGRPAAASPCAGASGVSVEPRLDGSPYSDPDGGDLQSASQWQVSTQPGDYTAPVFDNARLDGPLLASVVVTPRLDPGTTYYWRVRYRDSHGAWSDWSEESSFTTQKAEGAGPGNGMTPASWIYVAGVALAVALALAAVLCQNARHRHPE